MLFVHIFYYEVVIVLQLPFSLSVPMIPLHVCLCVGDVYDPVSLTRVACMCTGERLFAGAWTTHRCLHNG